VQFLVSSDDKRGSRRHTPARPIVARRGLTGAGYEGPRRARAVLARRDSLQGAVRGTSCHADTVAPSIPNATRWRNALYRRIGLRLVPILFVAFALAMMDRAAISYAKLQFLSQLSFSESIYGFGAGLFYIGYTLCEVPSNIYLQKKGVRLTLLRIMTLWGAVTALTSLIRTPGQFYLARLMLGIAEGGFMPGVLLYFTYWFPADRIGRINALLLIGNPISGMIGGLVAAHIMTHFAGQFGLVGWRVLFLDLGIPTMLLGLLCYLCLANGPEEVNWLNEPEKAFLRGDLNDINKARDSNAYAFFRDSRVYIAGLGYFTVTSALTTLSLWGPSVVNELGVSDLKRIGLLNAVPCAIGVIAMIVVSRSSDYFVERRWHFVSCSLVAAAGFAGVALFHAHLILAVAMLCLAAFGTFGGLPLYLTMPGEFLPRTSAAGGIALVTTTGGLGAFLTPWILGVVKTSTGSLYPGLVYTALLCLLGAGLVALVMHGPRFEAPDT
jgi:MFS family permease